MKSPLPLILAASLCAGCVKCPEQHTSSVLIGLQMTEQRTTVSINGEEAASFHNERFKNVKWSADGETVTFTVEMPKTRSFGEYMTLKHGNNWRWEAK